MWSSQEFLNALLRHWQFRANTTTAVDTATRSVPLLVAVQKGSDAVVRLLLSYGAYRYLERAEG